MLDGSSRLLELRRGAPNVHFSALMMLEFDNSTLANMTAALDHACKMLSADLDTADNRKRIGDAIIAAAKSHRRSLSQLIEVAQHEVTAILGPPQPSLVGVILKRFKSPLR